MNRPPMLCTVAARDLSLYATNDGATYRAHSLPTVIALARKIAAGKYDPERAPVAWQHVADRAAESYSREFSTGKDSRDIFSTATRRAAAAEIADYYQDVLTEYAADMTAGRRSRVTGAEKPGADNGESV